MHERPSGLRDRTDGPTGVMRTIGARWWDAVSGGRFYSPATAAITFPVAVTVLGAFVGVRLPQDLVAAVVVSALGWVVLAAALVPAVWAERRLNSAGARAGVVLGSLLVAAVARPFVNDALTGILIPTAEPDLQASRVVTNVVCWFILTSMIAVADDSVLAAGAVNRRLQQALAALARGADAHHDVARGARLRIGWTVAVLRRDLDRLSSGQVDFDRVREFSDAVRTASHALDAAADRDDRGALVSLERSRGSIAEWLRSPPLGMVGVLYAAAVSPYLARVLSPGAIVADLLLLIAITILGDVVQRAAARGRSARVRGALILIVSVLVGAVVSLLSLALVPGPAPVAFVSLLVIPVLTVLAAVAEEAVHRLQAEQRILSDALAAFRGAASAGPGDPAALLRSAAAMLHGPVQGRCVVFAASLEDDPATADGARDFVAAVDAVLDDVRDVDARTPGTADTLDGLLEAWSDVLELSVDISPAAAAVLSSTPVARSAAAIVSEALVNAVKHSGARRAAVVMRTEPGAEGTLEVEVASPGRLRMSRSGDGRGLARLGPRASVVQRGPDVVLSAGIPLPSMV